MNPRFLSIAALALLNSSSLWGADVVLIQFERNEELLDPVVIELFEKEAPAHVANFKRLVDKGFYKGLAVHRVVPQTLVQLGDPLSRGKNRTDLGTGGPGYTLAPEIQRKHVRGAVGMGRLPDALNPGRLSNGSQFYVVLSPLGELDGKQTVFGQVREGLGVWDMIGGAATDTNDSPIQRVVVKKAIVVSEEKASRELDEMKAKTHRSTGVWWQRLVRSFALFR